MWLPQFACPECRAPLESGAPVTCACGAAFTRRGDIHGFLTDRLRRSAADFARQYARVREADGHREVCATFWSDLPRVPRTHPAAGEWRIRQESFQRLLAIVFARPIARRVLDLGAGCGWLSARLAERGHSVVALDRLDDEEDRHGLGRCAHVVAVRGAFEALPFVPAQFDVVVFNASLHYASNPEAVLESSAGMLVPGGTLVVMDSPIFARAADGERMASSTPPRSTRGYLTYGGLDDVATRLGHGARFFPSRGPWSWRFRRALARQRLDREPAAFGVWVAR